MTNIQVKRGNEANLPTLNVGEPALTLDSERVFIGAPSGNKELAKQGNVDQLTTDIAESAKKTDHTVTPESFGAVGDGVADDTTEIQAMFDSLTTKSNKVIFNPFKTYKISAKINIPDKSNLVVVGYGAKLKLTGDFVGLDFGSSGLTTNKNNIYVLGLEVEGAETNVGSRNFSTGALIQFTKITNISVRDCIVHNGNCNGISAIDCLEVSFVNNKVYDVNLHPIWTNRCDNVLVEWNRLTGIGNVGGTMPIGTSGEVSRGGIGYLGTRGSKHFIRNNIIKNMSDTASKTEGANDVIYEGNYVEECGKDGIKIQDYQATLTGLSAWYYGNPDYKVRNGKIINNTVKNLNAWRSDGSSLVLAHNCLGVEISGNIVHGGNKVTSITDLNGVVKSQEENAIRVQYCEDVVVSGHIEKTATTTESYYFNDNKNVSMSNCKFKKHGKWNYHTGNDFISNNDIGNNPSNLNDNSFLAIHPAHITMHNNRIDGLVQIQPSTNTKGIKIKSNTITQYGTTDAFNITNYTTNNASVENVELTDNTFKMKGIISAGRVGRISCDKSAYTFVKFTGNYAELNGQSLAPLSILTDASGNNFKIQTLQIGQNLPAYTTTSSDVVTSVNVDLWNRISDSTTIVSTTPITTYTAGKFTFADITSSNSDLANFPEGTTGTLLTYRSSSGDLWSWQEYQIRNTNRIYRRLWDNTNNVWLAWGFLIPYKKTATLDFPSIPANSTAELTIFLSGATIGDSVYATPSDSTTPGTAIENGLMWSACVKSTNFITVRLANITTSAIDPVSRTWKIDWSK